MFSRLRVVALLGSRLLPIIGPLLCERDILRSRCAALELEAELDREVAGLRTPKFQARLELGLERHADQGPVWL
mgnify:CR=1 FL=1